MSEESLFTTMFRSEPLTPGTCEFCGIDCDPVNHCCSLSCEAQLRRLEAHQGRLVMRSLKFWRKHRGRKDTPGEGQMTKVAGMIDSFLKSDRLRREQAQLARRKAAALETPTETPTET